MVGMTTIHTNPTPNNITADYVTQDIYGRDYRYQEGASRWVSLFTCETDIWISDDRGTHYMPIMTVPEASTEAWGTLTVGAN